MTQGISENRMEVEISLDRCPKELMSLLSFALLSWRLLDSGIRNLYNEITNSNRSQQPRRGDGVDA